MCTVLLPPDVNLERPKHLEFLNVYNKTIYCYNNLYIYAYFCLFLYCNHQMHRDVLITLYKCTQLQKFFQESRCITLYLLYTKLLAACKQRLELWMYATPHAPLHVYSCLYFYFPHLTCQNYICHCVRCEFVRVHKLNELTR
jgi:hypothetical protein